MYRPPGQILEIRNRIAIRMHHHQFTHFIIGLRKCRLLLPLLSNGHCRRHDIALAFIQIRQQFGVTIRNNNFEAQVVLRGKSLHKFVFEPYLLPPVNKIRHRIIARDHPQPAAFFQARQIIGKRLLAVARKLMCQQVLIHPDLELCIAWAHHQGERTIFGHNERRDEIIVITGNSMP